MNSKKVGKNGQKRKKSKDQNDSVEKPSKKQSNSAHSQTENVNKQKEIQTCNTVNDQLYTMSRNTNCVSPNMQGLQQMQQIP